MTRKKHFLKTHEVIEMKEIFSVEIKDSSVFLNGTKLSEEEVSHYLRNGLKYDVLKERFNFIQEARV